MEIPLTSKVNTSPPTVIVSSGYLVSIDSDSLGEVPVEISIHDSNAISDDPVVMNWIYLRNGRLLEDSRQCGTTSSLRRNRLQICGATVDMNTSEFTERRLTDDLVQQAMHQVVV